MTVERPFYLFLQSRYKLFSASSKLLLDMILAFLHKHLLFVQFKIFFFVFSKVLLMSVYYNGYFYLENKVGVHPMPDSHFLRLSDEMPAFHPDGLLNAHV